jgi:hypothetical protein
MHLANFPGLMKALLLATLALLFIASVIVVAQKTAIVALLSSAVNPLLATMIGAIVGFFLAKLLDWGRRRKEAADVTRSLYDEIADRAARCLNDYVDPWRAYEKSKDMKAARIGKFRPAQPVVYPAVAAKLGLIKSHALFSVIFFYFRLDAVRREIDDVTKAFKHDDDLLKLDPDRLELVKRRLHETFEPAVESLEKLDFGGSERIDAEAKQAYQHLRTCSNSLRQMLRLESDTHP